MSDFSDRPFAAGSLVGLRAFSVDSLGRLVGPAFGGVFKPGENVAKCGGETAAGQLMKMQADLNRRLNALSASYSVGGRLANEAMAKSAAKRPHVTGGIGCACGFYAYFDGRNDYSQPSRVAAIIEGYGVCTVGTRGFRAEKARLLAIVDPSKRRWWQSWKFNALLAALCTYSVITRAIDHEWLWMIVNALIVALNGGIAAWSWRREHKVAMDLVRRNYPDVPRFRTERAARKAFPLTPPEPITPETAEDFWTRSAR